MMSAHNAINMVVLLRDRGENFLLSSKKILIKTKNTKKIEIPPITNLMPFILLLFIILPFKILVLLTLITHKPLIFNN